MHWRNKVDYKGREGCQQQVFIDILVYQSVLFIFVWLKTVSQYVKITLNMWNIRQNTINTACETLDKTPSILWTDITIIYVGTIAHVNVVLYMSFNSGYYLITIIYFVLPHKIYLDMVVNLNTILIFTCKLYILV